MTDNCFKPQLIPCGLGGRGGGRPREDVKIQPGNVLMHPWCLTLECQPLFLAGGKLGKSLTPASRAPVSLRSGSIPCVCEPLCRQSSTTDALRQRHGWRS